MKLGANLLISATCLCGLAGLGWWWQQNMERVRVGQPETSKAALENPLLAAARLLRQNGHRVDESANLNLLALPTLPAGTLLLAENHGVMAQTQTAQLLDWVRRGNTLIMVPQPFDKPRSRLQARFTPAKTDPLGSYFGVHVGFVPPLARKCNPDDPAVPPEGAAASELNYRARIECFSLAGYRLTLNTDHSQLQSNEPSDRAAAATPTAPDSLAGHNQGNRGDDEQEGGNQTSAAPTDAKQPSLECKVGSPAAADDDADDVDQLTEQRAVRIYAQGKGRVVMLATNYFNNQALPLYDHAELLLHLTHLAPGGHVQLVRMLATVPWYAALWNGFPLLIVSLAAALLLWLWRAVRRFGPMLPDPLPRRRALMEHVNASGRWLWQSPAGRIALLEATRSAALAAVGRRAPELLRLAPDEQCRQLADACRLAPGQLDAALHGAAPSLPADFTRHISTLHTLREHYAHQQR